MFISSFLCNKGQVSNPDYTNKHKMKSNINSNALKSLESVKKKKKKCMFIMYSYVVSVNFSF